MRAEKAEPAKAVVVATKRSIGKRGVSVIIVVAVILAAGGAAAWYMMHQRSADKAEQTAKQQSQPSVSQVSEDVNKKLVAKDYKGAIQVLENQSTQTSETKTMLAAAYVGAGEYAKALETYKELDNANQLSGSNTVAAAQFAEQDKDYATAIAYYKKAKERLKAENDETAGDQIQLCDYKITELQKLL